MGIKLSASIIAGDFYNLEKLIKETEKSDIDYLHLDVMDGNFVPNITFGTSIVKKIKNITKLPLDVHLMVNNPEIYIEEIIEYINMINFHIEVIKFPFRFIENIKNIIYSKNLDVKVGVAVNPVTDVGFLKYLKGYIDNVLVMTVDPGFFGQKFIENMLFKISLVKEIIKDWGDVFISVDGGVNDENIEKIIKAGANYIVISSFLYKGNIIQNVEKIKGIINKIKY
ncbi:MAG: ribulose-phosphate 3-epimerase [bacterium]|nr:ribulose-phosphate 3-epimerase [bacterium]